MNKWTVVIVVVLSLEAVPADCGTISSEITCDGAVREQAWVLLAGAQFGRSNRERAAFVVRSANGGYVFQLWPFDVVKLRATFEGAIPAGAVAVIHTHPNTAEFPSENDRLLSARIGLPIYVVTRWRISKAEGGRVESVWHGSWHEPDHRLEAPFCTAPRLAQSIPDSMRGPQ